jgi:hypothetical protein
MKKIILVFALIVFIFAAAALAETEIKAGVDKTSLTTDEMLTYKLIITSSEKSLPDPEFPEFAGFEVVSQALSSTVSFVKGAPNCILVYAFVLAAQDKGKFQIAPSSIKVKGKTYSTQSFEIEVKPDKEKKKPQPIEEPPLMPQLPDRTDEPRVTL